MTRMTDLIHNSKVVEVATDTVANTVIDTLGFYSALFIALAEQATFTVTESDKENMDDAVAVPETQLIKGKNSINVVPTKRYIKVVAGASKVAGLLFGADVDGKINE